MKPAARSELLLAIRGEKAVRVDGGRQAEAGAAQHRRPEQRMEIENVLADEVIQLGGAVLAPEVVELEILFGAQVLEARHVANRCIEPHVEEFSGRVRNLETEGGREIGRAAGGDRV